MIKKLTVGSMSNRQRAAIEAKVCKKIIDSAERRLEHHYIIDKSWVETWLAYL